MCCGSSECPHSCDISVYLNPSSQISDHTVGFGISDVIGEQADPELKSQCFALIMNTFSQHEENKWIKHPHVLFSASWRGVNKRQQEMMHERSCRKRTKLLLSELWVSWCCVVLTHQDIWRKTAGSSSLMIHSIRCECMGRTWTARWGSGVTEVSSST